MAIHTYSHRHRKFVRDTEGIHYSAYWSGRDNREDPSNALMLFKRRVRRAVTSDVLSI